MMDIYLANQVVKTEEELALYQRNLEGLVDERSLELKSSNDQLVLEITVRENLEKDLQKSERTARALLNAPQDSSLAAEQIQGFNEFSPRQKPGSFNLDRILEKTKEATSGGLR